MNLEQLGWHTFFSDAFAGYEGQDLIPGRVIRCERNQWTVATTDAERPATIIGKVRFSGLVEDIPTVGDWVAVLPDEDTGTGIIHAVLPRRTRVSRKAVSSGGLPESGGRSDEQLLAANIDYLFIVAGLDNDFNVRRIERYLLTAYEGGTTPVIVLNKTDVCEDVERRVLEVQPSAPGVDILRVSAATGEGMEQFKTYLRVGKTGALVGSSGTGKSTIINRLLGFEKQATTAVRNGDSRGRHTTTRRELIVLPSGGILIDSPGMRELQIWVGQETMKKAFADIESLAEGCRFRDCSHTQEPGCAVLAAVKDGSLAEGRLKSYHKLQREQQRLEIRRDGKEKYLERRRGKKFAALVKQVKRLKGR